MELIEENIEKTTWDINPKYRVMYTKLAIPGNFIYGVPVVILPYSPRKAGEKSVWAIWGDNEYNAIKAFESSGLSYSEDDCGFDQDSYLDGPLRDKIGEFLGNYDLDWISGDNLLYTDTNEKIAWDIASLPTLWWWGKKGKGFSGCGREVYNNGQRVWAIWTWDDNSKGDPELADALYEKYITPEVIREMEGLDSTKHLSSCSLREVLLKYHPEFDPKAIHLCAGVLNLIDIYPDGEREKNSWDLPIINIGDKVNNIKELLAVIEVGQVWKDTTEHVGCLYLNICPQFDVNNAGVEGEDTVEDDSGNDVIMKRWSLPNCAWSETALDEIKRTFPDCLIEDNSFPLELIMTDKEFNNLKLSWDIPIQEPEAGLVVTNIEELSEALRPGQVWSKNIQSYIYTGEDCKVLDVTIKNYRGIGNRYLLSNVSKAHYNICKYFYLEPTEFPLNLVKVNRNINGLEIWVNPEVPEPIVENENDVQAEVQAWDFPNTDSETEDPTNDESYANEEDFNVKRNFYIPYSETVFGDIILKATCKKQAIEVYEQGIDLGETEISGSDNFEPRFNDIEDSKEFNQVNAGNNLNSWRQLVTWDVPIIEDFTGNTNYEVSQIMVL
jgi:hypothetical protein